MSKIARIASYPVSVIYLLLFGLSLVIFDVLQRITLNLFGYKTHKTVVDLNNLVTVTLMRIFLGTKFEVKNLENIPTDKPYIIISNHQSMWEIPPSIWYLRKLHPKFVAKAELAKGVPTISYNLKHGGSVLIDRKDREQSTKRLKDFAVYLMKNKRSGIIYPEGTRSRSSQMRDFKPGGLKTLFENMQGAYVLPISVANSWKFDSYGGFRVAFGVNFKLTAHEPIKLDNQDFESFLVELENIVRSETS